MFSFAPEIPANVASLSVSVGNSCTSNPISGVRFEMQLPPPRAVGLADLGAEVKFSVISIAVREVPVPDGG